MRHLLALTLLSLGTYLAYQWLTHPYGKKPARRQKAVVLSPRLMSDILEAINGFE